MIKLTNIIKENINTSQRIMFKWPNGIKRGYTGDEILNLLKRIDFEGLIEWSELSQYHNAADILNNISKLTKKL